MIETLSDDDEPFSKSPVKTPVKSQTETDDSNDYNPAMLDAIFSQVKEACVESSVTITPAPAHRPVKEQVSSIPPGLAVALNFDETNNKNVPEERRLADDDLDQVEDDVFQPAAENEEKNIAQPTKSAPPCTVTGDAIPDRILPEPVVDEPTKDASDSDDADATLCIDDGEEESSNTPVARQMSLGFAVDTPKIGDDDEFNKLWNVETTEYDDSQLESVEQLEDQVKAFAGNMPQPFFVRQFDDVYLISLHSTLVQITDLIPSALLRYIVKISELQLTVKISTFVFQLVRSEMRNFKKARLDVKAFRRIEALFIIYCLLLKGATCEI